MITWVELLSLLTVMIALVELVVIIYSSNKKN